MLSRLVVSPAGLQPNEPLQFGVSLIRGLAMLAEVTIPPSLVVLAARLPREMHDLTSTIIEEIRTYYLTKGKKFRRELRNAGVP